MNQGYLAPYIDTKTIWKTS